MDVREVKPAPPVIPVGILGMSFFGGEFRGRRVRVITGSGDWHEEIWYVYGPGVEVSDTGAEFVEVIPAEHWWKLRLTGKVDVTQVVRWPAGAVFLDG